MSEGARTAFRSRLRALIVSDHERVGAIRVVDDIASSVPNCPAMTNGE
jgi:hypothetical protein